MSAPPPRRPGGARPVPSGGRERPKLGLALGIPSANVPGVNVDQAGEGCWKDSMGRSLPQQSSAGSASTSSHYQPSASTSTSTHVFNPSSTAQPPPLAINVSAPPPRRPPMPTNTSSQRSSSGSLERTPIQLHQQQPPSQLQSAAPSQTAPSPSPSASRPTISSNNSRPRLPQLSFSDTPLLAQSSSDSNQSIPSSSSTSYSPAPAPIPPQSRSKGPSLTLQVGPASSTASPPPPPPPPPSLNLHLTPSSSQSFNSLHPSAVSSSSSSSSYRPSPYDYNDTDEDRTVRPLSMDSDAGSYGAYGSIGGIFAASSSSARDRTLQPGGGGGEGGRSSSSSMTDDLRTAISSINFRSAPGTPMPNERTSELAYEGAGGEGEMTVGADGRGEGGAGNGHEEEVQPLAFDPKDLEELAYLGEGAGGAVMKVRSRRTGKVMAKKLIPASPNPSIHRQILRELQFLSTCTSPHIVDHYGSFLTDGDSMIGILMEFCEGKSLDAVVRESREREIRSSERVLGKIAVAVLRGLDYLHARKIIHRDIKPSNILVTRQGQFKICDFGVSGELVGSLAGTFTGTSFYMAPERILGQDYSIKSDVWSLGLSLLEVANNRFPFPPEGEPPIVGQFDLLNFIVNQPPPGLVDDEAVVWSDGAKDLVKLCLTSSASERPYPRDLIHHPFVKSSEKKKTDLAKWVAHVWEW